MMGKLGAAIRNKMALVSGVNKAAAAGKYKANESSALIQNDDAIKMNLKLSRQSTSIKSPTKIRDSISENTENENPIVPGTMPGTPQS
jgi:hypothetical protein